MPDTDPNLTIDVTGNTGSIATEWVTTGGITNAHVQIVKLAWGDANTATRVKTSTPLPVTLISSSSTLGISGAVSGSGNFRMINGLSGSTTLPLIVQGTTASGTTPLQISGTVEGVLNGVKVGITGDVTVTNTVTIQGVSGNLGNPVGITGGRRLNYLTDSVTVNGTVGVSGGRYLIPATDGVKVYSGIDGGSTLSVKIADGSGNVLTSTGGALNVNLIGAGITATVSISPIVGISQANQAVPLFIAGATAGPAVRIKGGLTGGIVEVGWGSALPVSIDPSSALNLTYDDTNTVNQLLAVRSSLVPITTATDAIQTAVNTISSRIPSNQVYTTNTNVVISDTVYTGTIDLSSSGSNVQIFNGISTVLKNGITIKSLATTNATSTMIKVSSVSGGTLASSPYWLSAGESLFVSVNNTNKLTFGSNGSAVSMCFIAT